MKKLILLFLLAIIFSCSPKIKIRQRIYGYSGQKWVTSDIVIKTSIFQGFYDMKGVGISFSDAFPLDTDAEILTNAREI